MIHGLMTRGWARDKQNDKYDLLIRGNVVNLSWKALQPDKGGDLTARAVDTIKQAAVDGPVRLRVLGGTNSPDWVMQENDSFGYHEDQGGDDYECPRWWYDSYIEAWEELQLRLYNAVHDYVAEVCQTGGATRYGEPFIKGPWSNKAAYREMGFTYEVDAVALDRFYQIMRGVWAEKVLVLSVFPWQYMEDGRPGSSIDRTFDAVDRWQPDLIGTHNLRADPNDKDLAVYDRMLSTGIPLYFQTAEPARFQDWRGGLEVGIEYGALNIELPHHFPEFDYADLADYAYRLEQQ